MLLRRWQYPISWILYRIELMLEIFNRFLQVLLVLRAGRHATNLSIDRVYPSCRLVLEFPFSWLSLRIESECSLSLRRGLPCVFFTQLWAPYLVNSSLCDFFLGPSPPYNLDCSNSGADFHSSQQLHSIWRCACSHRFGRSFFPIESIC